MSSRNFFKKILRDRFYHHALDRFDPLILLRWIRRAPRGSSITMQAKTTLNGLPGTPGG